MLSKNISKDTFRRWRRQTGLTDAWMSDRDVWMIAIYGKYVGLYRNAAKALEKANEFIHQMENDHEQSAA